MHERRHNSLSERGLTCGTYPVGGGPFKSWMERMRGETRTVSFAYAAGLGGQIVTATC